MKQNIPIRTGSGHYSEIDGIRGWAALIVVLFHCFSEMLKNIVPAVNAPALAPFFAGEFAVLVFFVLSGDALSATFFANYSTTSIDRLLVRRYFRLTIPILMSCLLTYCILRLNLDFHNEAAEILDRADWLGTFLQLNSSLFNLLKYALMNVYTSHTREQSFNPFLWTMSIEIIGSMFVFLYCYLWGKLQRPALICAGITTYLLMTGSFYSLFFGGIYLGYLRKSGQLLNFRISKKAQAFSLCFVVALVSLKITQPFGPASNTIKPIIQFSAIAFVFCLYISKPLLFLMRGNLSRFLGEISFPLYLVHFQVIISLMSWLVIKGAVSSSGNSSYLGYAAVAVIASIIAAYIFRYIEKHILRIIDPLVLKILG